MAPKGRPACTLDVEELREVFESHGLQQLKPGAFQAVNVCTVHGQYVSLFKTLLNITKALSTQKIVYALPAVNLTAEQKNNPVLSSGYFFSTHASTAFRK